MERRVLQILMILGGAILIYTLVKNRIEFSIVQKAFVQTKLKGEILKIQNLGRGTCFLTVNDKLSADTIKFELYLSYEVKLYKIQEGDSIYKSNDNDVTIWRRNSVADSAKVSFEYKEF